MPDVTMLAVGQAYPEPEVISEPSAGWHPDAGVILISDHGMTPERAHQEWDGARLWLAGSGPLVVLVAKLANGDELEMPAAWVDGHNNQPEWVADGATNGKHLAVTIVSVDCDTHIVARMNHITFSPHFTAQLIKLARNRWTEPLTPPQYLAAVNQHQTRFPDIKSLIRSSIASTRLGD